MEGVSPRERQHTPARQGRRRRVLPYQIGARSAAPQRSAHTPTAQRPAYTVRVGIDRRGNNTETLSRGFTLHRLFRSRAPGSKDNTAFTARALLCLLQFLPNTSSRWKKPRSTIQSACPTRPLDGNSPALPLRVRAQLRRTPEGRLGLLRFVPQA